MGLVVKLQIFKPTGKWYTNGEYVTEQEELFEIWDEVKEKVRRGGLPGLIPGHCEDWMVLVDVPEHEHRHPYIVRTINI